MKGCGTLEKGKTVLVCVTGQHDCDRLIRTGKEIAAEQSLSMQVLCVQPNSSGFEADCEELEYLRQTARDAGAEMSVYFNDDAALTAASVAKHIGAAHIVTGMAGSPADGDRLSGGFIEMLHKLLPSVPISMVAKDRTIYNICPTKKDEKAAKSILLKSN